jgi:hypothetical protein
MKMNVQVTFIVIMVVIASATASFFRPPPYRVDKNDIFVPVSVRGTGDDQVILPTHNKHQGHLFCTIICDWISP